MKNITTYILILAVSLLIESCKGPQGDIGPAGVAGTAGKNGTNGTNGATGTTGGTGTAGTTGGAGATGDKGGTGATGDKGAAGTLTMTTTDWKSFSNFKKGTDLSTAYTFVDNTALDFSKIIPVGADDLSLFREIGRHIVTNSNGTPLGFIYTYYKITENGTSFVFPESLSREPVNIDTDSFGFSTSLGLSHSMSIYFNKNSYNDQSNLIKEISDRNPSSRLVFLPLALKNGRMAHVDMNNYEEVKIAFNLRD